MPKCEKCDNRAHYGTKKDRNKRCKDHKLLSDYSTDTKFCEIDECLTTAIYGSKDTRIRRFCAKHKSSQDVDLCHKMCVFLDCKTMATFKKSEKSTPKYCKKHAPKNFISKRSLCCLFKGCKTRRLFGKKDSDKPEFCKKHAPKDYVNVKKRLCECPTCEITASYRLPDEITHRWCKKHAPIDAIDSNKKCLKCNKRATFCDENSKEKKYCKDHKPNNSISTDKRKCTYPNCKKQPSYGLRDDLELKKATRCSEHKEPGMIDVIHKKCNYKSCAINPTYGYPGYSMERCVEHKLPRMIAYSKQKPKEDVKTCDYCQADIQYYEDFCNGCKKYVEEKVTIRLKIKENRIRDMLIDNEINFVHNKQINNSVSRRRPDFLIKTEWGFIVLEVDEFQHRKKTYPEECEYTRMLQIYNELIYNELVKEKNDNGDDKRVIFVRYNPDNYKPYTNNKKLSKEDREKYLYLFISELDINKPEDKLAMYQLFYDGFNFDEPCKIFVN